MTLKKKLFIFALTLTVIGSAEMQANTLEGSPDYSSGMSSYMNGEFEAAKTYWLAAARANDGKAMFNLGLLHERKKIAGASQQTAEQWFQQAGNAGYAPADYHLALALLEQGQTAQANSLLTRSANAGFVLAQERLGTPQTDKASKQIGEASQKQVSVAVKKPSQNKKPSQKKQPSQKASARAMASAYNREDWIANKPPEFWTIQMLAFSDEAKVRNFIDDHGLHRNAAYFAEGKGANTVYKLIYGSYASKQEADAVRSGLTATLKEHGPWLRPIKRVQAIISQK